MARSSTRCPESLNAAPALEVSKQAEGEGQDEEPTKALGLTVPQFRWPGQIRSMSRKDATPRQRRAKPRVAPDPDAATVSVLPMNIQIGDRFTDAEGEW